MTKRTISTFFCVIFFNTAFAATLEPIAYTFVEPYQCGSNYPKGYDCGIRYKIKNVSIESGGNLKKTTKGGIFNVTMDILHDCRSCGNAINQIIVGLSSDEKAQISVWNGKQRSGGDLKIVNRGTNFECLVEDNDYNAKWRKVYFSINVPHEKGKYYIRTRYAQAYTGNLLTEEGIKQNQPFYTDPLGWWKIDRANGPTESSNIGVIIVE